MFLTQLLKQFFRYLKARNRSQGTIANYQFYLERFLGLTKITKPVELSLGQVERYRSWLNQQTDKLGKLLSPATKDYHLIALRSFIKYLAGRGLLKFSPEKIWLNNAPRRPPGRLSKTEVNQLLEAPLGRADRGLTLTQWRDKAILELIWSTGLKVSKLAGLKRGKNLVLSHQANYWLNQYLNARRDTNPYLFIAHDRALTGRSKVPAGLSPRSIERMIAKYKKLCGLTRAISPEILRRSRQTPS